MDRTLTPDPNALASPGAGAVASNGSDDHYEFEFVLGPRQLAAMAFVGVTLLAVVSGVTYLAGKVATGTASAAVRNDVVPRSPVTVSPAKASATDSAKATVAAESKTGAGADAKAGGAGSADATANSAAATASAIPVLDGIITSPDAPLFGEPEPGVLYIQMGAVEKGIAVVFVEGLRTHGLPAFAGPGPGSSDSIFRVLIGPLPNETAFQAAQREVDSIGLTTFPRRYQAGE